MISHRLTEINHCQSVPYYQAHSIFQFRLLRSEYPWFPISFSPQLWNRVQSMIELRLDHGALCKFWQPLIPTYELPRYQDRHIEKRHVWKASVRWSTSDNPYLQCHCSRYNLLDTQSEWYQLRPVGFSKVSASYFPYLIVFWIVNKVPKLIINN